MSYIIVARPPVVENPMTEEEPVRFTSGDTLEEAMKGGPVLVRPATIEAVSVEGEKIGLELLQEHIGGYIEVAYRLRIGSPDSGETIDFIGDEEALLKKLMPTMVRPSDGWVLRGPLVVARCTAEGEHIPLTRSANLSGEWGVHADAYFHDIWGMFSVLGFVDVRRVPDA